MKNNRDLDDFNLFSEDEFVFNEEVHLKESNTKRITVDTKDIEFISFDDFIGSSQCMKDKLIDYVSELLSIDKETLIDTKDNTNLVAIIQGNPYLVGESSYMSLEGRMGICGPGVKLLPSKLLATVLNERFKQLNSVTVIISYNKIRSIMTTKYKVLTSEDILSSVTDNIALKYGMYELSYGQINHRTTSAVYLINDLKEELQSAYKLPDEFEPGLYVANSDTGYSSTVVTPFFRPKGSKSGFLIEDSISLIHMGDNQQQFSDDLDGLFHRFINVPQRLFKLMNIDMDYPITALENALEKMKIGKKLSEKVKEDFQARFTGANVTVTAYDVCMSIINAPALLDTDREEVLHSLEKVLGKALTLNYEKLQQ